MSRFASTRFAPMPPATLVADQALLVASSWGDLATARRLVTAAGAGHGGANFALLAACKGGHFETARWLAATVGVADSASDENLALRRACKRVAPDCFDIIECVFRRFVPPERFAALTAWHAFGAWAGCGWFAAERAWLVETFGDDAEGEIAGHEVDPGGRATAGWSASGRQ
jgi:hypothetical protein